jgi:hypothetical protein
VTDTRPSELSRSEAQRIAQETAALLKIADNEREYREHVLTSLVRMEVKLDALQESFKDHVKLDDSRFGTVNQRIASNTSWISKGTGIIAAVVVMLGVIMWVVDKVSP